MKERIVYDEYEDPEQDWKIVFYKKSQYLTWRFYIRIIQDGGGWFTPCKKCQTRLTDAWNKNFNLLDLDDLFVVRFMVRAICSDCVKKINKKLRERPIIVGNKTYEPWVEIQRAWVDDDNSYEDVTKEEYSKHR